jgi:hypothetical protein
MAFLKEKELRFFNKAYLSCSMDGKFELNILFKIYSMLQANC